MILRIAQCHILMLVGDNAYVCSRHADGQANRCPFHWGTIPLRGIPHSSPRVCIRSCHEGCFLSCSALAWAFTIGIPDYKPQSGASQVLRRQINCPPSQRDNGQLTNHDMHLVPLETRDSNTTMNPIPMENPRDDERESNRQ